MLPTFARETVTIIHPGTMQDRGVIVPDWEHATRSTVAGCSVQPAGTSRTFASARVLNIQDAYTLYAPPGAPIVPGDRKVKNANFFPVKTIGKSEKSLRMSRSLTNISERGQ